MAHLNLCLQNDRLTGVLSGAHVVIPKFLSVVKNRITLLRYKLFFIASIKTETYIAIYIWAERKLKLRQLLVLKNYALQ